MAERRAEGARRGGKGKANTARASKLMADGAISSSELLGLLGVLMRGTMDGRYEPNVANACANVAKAITAIRASTEIEERLTALEESVGAGNAARWRA